MVLIPANSDIAVANNNAQWQPERTSHRYARAVAGAFPRRKNLPEVAPDPAGVDVRHIQPYEATKTYRCPGCDHEIAPGTGHEVVVPREAPEHRRHWHSACWRQITR